MGTRPRAAGPPRWFEASPRRRGATAPALLFWVLGIAVFVLPFFRQPFSAEWVNSDDPRSAKNWKAEDQPYNELDVPFKEDLAYYDKDLASELGGKSLAEFVNTASEEYFGVKSSYLRDSGVIEVGRLASGRKTYEAECAGCHGIDGANTVPGDGGGPAARFMHPRPRNFRKGKFKFTSTATGERPMRKDLYRTVTNGLAGSSMPSFKLLTDERRKDVVEYVRYIAMRGEFEEMLLSITIDDGSLPDAKEYADLVSERWDERKLSSVFPSTPETQNDAASIARGKALYMDTSRANCVSCHGETGVGDGPSAKAFKDEWGYPIVPRDFTGGVYRSGGENAQLWTVIATGIGGTPMAAFAGSLSSDEIWDVVHYVRSLERKEN
ncbi:MAG: cytochrome c [Planctomycetes bacterium]|nr:cytochrome c [Planctomycetota bacterium]